MHALLRESATEARRAWPYAVLLGVALGAIVVIGANYSNAFPSEQRPFGWPGPSGFENAVAMVRGDIVVATTLPALLLGATLWRAPGRLGVAMATDGLLVLLAVGLATLIGAIGAADTRSLAYLSFYVAHALLALSFYSLAALCSIAATRYAAPVALAVWLVLNAGYESVVRTVLFRTEGYDALSTGVFPPWFFVAQAFSPLTAYRGVLILWDRRMMDGLEKAVLGDAALPAWLNPLTMGAFMVALWIALPLALAGLLAWWRRRAAGRDVAAQRSPAS